MSVLYALLALVLSVAFAQDHQCQSVGGTCQIDSLPCSGNYVTGKCSGAANRRCCTWSAASDQSCLSQGGKCQADSVSCSGSYVSGQCAGPANRRCCMPTPSGSGGSCSAQQKNLACGLFRSPNVRTATAHVSGEQDNAFPYNNLRDMCDGKLASRSSYNCGKCFAPGGGVCLTVSLLNYLTELAAGGSLYINELAGACHSCGSKHFTGNAVDLRKEGRATEYVNTCRRLGGVGIDENTHIHCQF